MGKEKSHNKVTEVIMWILATIFTIGLAGLFINGTMLNVILLEYLPLIVHKVIGWATLGLLAVGLIMKIIK